MRASDKLAAAEAEYRAICQRRREHPELAEEIQPAATAALSMVVELRKEAEDEAKAEAKAERKRLEQEQYDAYMAEVLAEQALREQRRKNMYAKRREAKLKTPEIKDAEARLRACYRARDTVWERYTKRAEVIRLEIAEMRKALAPKKPLVDPHAEKHDRNLEIWRDRQAGMSDAAIGRKHAINSSRVSAILGRIKRSVLSSGIRETYTWDKPIDFETVDYLYGVDFEYVAGREGGYGSVDTHVPHGQIGRDAESIKADQRYEFMQQAAIRLGTKYGVHPKLFYHLEELRQRDPKVCAEVEGHLISYKVHPLLMPYYTV
jgi:hypothetical protein